LRIVYDLLIFINSWGSCFVYNLNAVCEQLLEQRDTELINNAAVMLRLLCVMELLNC